MEKEKLAQTLALLFIAIEVIGIALFLAAMRLSVLLPLWSAPVLVILFSFLLPGLIAISGIVLLVYKKTIPGIIALIVGILMVFIVPIFLLYALSMTPLL
ncbi:MAG: hypothetical protein V1847_04395 [Candidatus Diapherotrites archaeon]